MRNRSRRNLAKGSSEDAAEGVFNHRSPSGNDQRHARRPSKLLQLRQVCGVVGNRARAWEPSNGCRRGDRSLRLKSIKLFLLHRPGRPAWALSSRGWFLALKPQLHVPVAYGLARSLLYPGPKVVDVEPQISLADTAIGDLARVDEVHQAAKAYPQTVARILRRSSRRNSGGAV